MTGKDALKRVQNCQEEHNSSASYVREGDRGEYLPSQEEIARETAKIREGWRLSGKYSGSLIAREEISPKTVHRLFIREDD